MPWVLRADVEGRVSWTVFHPDAHRAHGSRLCQVCGEKLGPTIILGAAEDSIPSDRRTSGPGCHPRCMALSARFCPHLRRITDREIIAFAYRGGRLGYRLYDSGEEEPDPTAAEIMDAYMQSMKVEAGACPLTRAEVLEIARRDPLGVDPGLDLTGLLR